MLFKGVMRHARMSRNARSRSKRKTASTRTSRPYNQRCAVRVTYSRNAVRGQWRAHGRYVARESATHEADPSAVGFDHERESIDIAAKLDAWQKAGDERMWKFIISPEFGDRVDLQRLTRDLMRSVASDLGGGQIEWTAVAHYNTEHPHVHVALRGVDRQNRPIQFDREYVKGGIRSIAEELCTKQLGYRTELDAAIAERHEVSQYRYTSLDRMIARAAGTDTQIGNPQSFLYTQQPTKPGVRDGVVLRQQHTMERLLFLQKMGLAECTGLNVWFVRRDFESVLRAMQRVADRQKTLARHGVLMSDDRLPVTVLDYRDLKSLEGRVLVHGEEEDGRGAGRSYLMLEGTDARVHHVYYTPEMEEARSRGTLRTNSFIRLRRMFVEGQPVLEINDLGDSEALLRNGPHLKLAARALIERGIMPGEDGWGGWLGQYQAALRRTALAELDRASLTEKTGAVRRRNKSHGR
jgi:type IV secretory pathway VirD2 relaxase